MQSGTQITVVGNLTDDPELRFTPAGVAVAKFSVAVNRRRYDAGAGEWVEAGTDYHRLTIWRQMAEHVAETLTKGMRVLAVGELKSRTWDDAKTGEKRTGWEVDVQAIGPDLTFATATVSKVAKSRPQNGAPADDAWSSASRTRPEVPAGRGYSEASPF